MTDLISLAERCEAATGPDRTLHWAIHAANLGKARPTRDELNETLDYTGSLDAAMTLVPSDRRVLIEQTLADRNKWRATLSHYDCGTWYHPCDYAATPALALCAAALRAIAQHRGESHSE